VSVEQETGLVRLGGLEVVVVGADGGGGGGEFERAGDGDGGGGGGCVERTGHPARA